MVIRRKEVCLVLSIPAYFPFLSFFYFFFLSFFFYFLFFLILVFPFLACSFLILFFSSSRREVDGWGRVYAKETKRGREEI